jgi:hypothetical protein
VIANFVGASAFVALVGGFILIIAFPLVSLSLLPVLASLRVHELTHAHTRAHTKHHAANKQITSPAIPTAAAAAAAAVKFL